MIDVATRPDALEGWLEEPTTPETTAPETFVPETFVLVGHGSRDPRSAQALERLTARVASLTDAPVRLAFLELSEPLLEDVLAQVSGRVRIVPLLLGSAFHARVDLPGRLEAVAGTRADLELSIAGVLGPHALLDAAMAAPARQLLAQGCDGLVLLGTGSSHVSANAEVDALADRLGLALGVPVVAGFVTRGRTLPEAVEAVRRAGAARVGLAPWFLAPGLLLDSGLAVARELGVTVATGGATQEAVTLADDERLARLVLGRALEPASRLTASAVDDASRRVLTAA